MSTGGLLILSLREYAAAMRRFDDFVRELARFNGEFGGRTLHLVMRSLRPVQKRKCDHLTEFRELLSHLDRVSKEQYKSAAPIQQNAQLSSAPREPG